ncbi:MAG: hypothetical protein AB9873_10900 [Syntrophobacteraceae bacterium]
MIRIALFTALAQEHTPLRRLTSPWERLKHRAARAYGKRFDNVECLLFETGMGRDRIERAIELACTNGAFDLVVSAGFAGSLDEQVGVGQVCIGEHFLTLPRLSPLTPEGTLLTSPVGAVATRFAAAMDLPRVRVATVERVQDKGALCQAIGGRATLVDMETYFAARAAAERSLAFLSLRSVSDGLEDPIDFDVEALSNAEGRIQVSRVIRQIGRSPRLLLSLIAAWKRSRPAAASLARTLHALLTLPSDDLDRIIKEQRVSTVASLESRRG